MVEKEKGVVVIDPQNNPVVLKDEQWKKHVAPHFKSLAGCKDEVLSVVTSPDKIYPSRPNTVNQRSSERLYFKTLGTASPACPMMIVAVDKTKEVINIEGYGEVAAGSYRIITAHPVDRQPLQRSIYTKKK